jgi:hypothetical protein
MLQGMWAHAVTLLDWTTNGVNNMYEYNDWGDYYATYIRSAMCIYLLVTFAIPNSNWTVLSVKLKDSTMGDPIVPKGKGELPTSWDLWCYTMFSPSK